MPTFTQEDLKQLQMMLRHSNNEDEIIAAMNILSEWQAYTAVPEMMRYLGDSRTSVRHALEAALLRLGQSAIPAIVEYLPNLDPALHVNLQELVTTYWKNASVTQLQRLVKHEDNRVRWAMAWTLAKPLQIIPPEDIAHVFEGFADEPLTAIRWAATQSLTTLAYASDNIPDELIQVALPVMVDNFKYGDINLSESSVGAIALLIQPPHPAINAMLLAESADLQVAAIKVLTAWVQDGIQLDDETLDALKEALPTANWQMTNEISRLRYVLSVSYPEALHILDGIPDTFDDDELEPTQDMRTTAEIMLLPLEDT